MRYSDVKVGKKTRVGEFTILGKPYRLVDSRPLSSKFSTTIIGRNCQIGSYVIIGKGTSIGDSCNLENYCQTEQSVIVGKRCHIIYNSHLCNDASIDDDCIIGGFIGERTRIECHVRMFGSTVHPQSNPTIPWDKALDEAAPVIKKWSFVGFGAVITGGITIGPQSYVLPNSMVTMNVPPKHIASGRNCFTHYKDWKGKLKDSPLFRGDRT